MNKEVTFIHAADLHLDSPFKGLANINETIFQEIKASTFIALDRLVTSAIKKQVDFILLTGDLFDNEKQSLKAQIALRDAFQRLKEADISVYLSYGNHDFIKGNQHQVIYPENVHIFPDETVRTFIYEKEGVPLASISGFSYLERKVEENKTADYTTEGIQAPLHIAMLHGSVQGNTDHDTYAPFLISELVNKNFDYWALGHIHKRMILKENPYIIYPGNTQGRHRNETGEKGCYFVRLSKQKTDIEFIPLNHITFSQIKLTVSPSTNLFDLEYFILNELKEAEMNTRQLIDLTLQSDNKSLRTWQARGQVDELMEIVNERLQQKNVWQYIFRQRSIIQTKRINEQAYYGAHFVGELERLFSNADIDQYLEDLYYHKQVRKYLNYPTATEENEFRERAKERLLDKLLKGEHQ